MKALVTGAGGFVGPYLVSALRDAGWRVVTLDRRGAVDLKGDLLRIPLHGITVDVVFHLAALSHPAGSVSETAQTFSANVAATGRLVQDVRFRRIVFASTSQVYGRVPSRENPVEESRPPCPRNPYAASKLCAEAIIRASPAEAVILRAFNHTGPGQTDSFVCPWIARHIVRAERGRGPRVVSVQDRAPKLDLFDVRDMVRAYVLAAERGKAGAVYNVATRRPVSIDRVAGILAGLSRVPIRITGPRRNRSVLSGDASSFRRATGWSPRIPLPRTLADLLTHERDINQLD